jgi:sugar lactone lactonase YvrE
VDSEGNLFIADMHNNVVRKVDQATAIITTVAGNGATGFDTPSGVTVDSEGNLLIADTGNNVVRKVDQATGIITTVAGNGRFGFSGDGGPAFDAQLAIPISVTVDSEGNLLIADGNNNRVRRVDQATGIITTVAGNGAPGFSGDGGLAHDAQLNEPSSVAVDSWGNLFITDTYNNVVRKVDQVTGIITTVAGNGAPGFSGDGGPAFDAQLSEPTSVAVDSEGNLFIADMSNSVVRKVDQNGVITTVAGNRPS